MDNYAEQLVKREYTSADKTKKIMIYICGIILMMALLLVAMFTVGTFFSFIAIILAIGAAYGAFRLAEGTNVEYEYLITNGELDFDKIIAKRKRQRLITVDVKKFEGFGKYNENLPEDSDMTVVICSDNIASHEYYADLKHDDFGQTRIIFAPNEKMLGAIKAYLPRNLRNII